MQTDTSQQRYHYMDNLRALAMLIGIVFHASLAYSPMMHFFWLTADQQNSKNIDVIAWFSHLFRMPLFFLIAGFFAMLLIEKRGLKSMLKNRVKRVLVPLVVFLPLVLFSIIAGISWAGSHIENQSPALAYMSQALQSTSNNNQPINLGHLWFLYYLCFMYLILVALYQLKLFHMTWIKQMLKPWVLLLIFPVLLVPVFYMIPAPHPAPEMLMPLLWPFGLYGLFFIIGALLFKQPDLLDQLDKYFYALLIIGLGSYVYFAYRVPAAESNLLMAVSESFTAAYMTWVCLILGRRWLNQPSKIFRYIADSSYWVYLIHIPVLFMTQYVLLDYEWNLWLELGISTTLTLAFGLASYALFVRWSPIGWLLNGKR